MIRKQIPNILTLCNLLCGCLSILSIFSGRIYWAAVFIFIAAVFDLLDGFFARLLRAYSPIGKELDSLSDVVSFGVAPSFIAYQMMQTQSLFCIYLPYLVFLMAAASAYRLAKFNIDTEQTAFFKGMPTPANALFWAALALHWANKGVVLNGYYLLALSIIFSFLLICNLKMFAFKAKDWSWQSQKIIYIFLVIVLALFIIYGALGLAIAIVFYPVCSWVHFHGFKLKKNKDI
ncbi:MAG: CDP-diacylglycerol--serine O-phosphatidyltransferase [Bacteroidales bacterium]